MRLQIASFCSFMIQLNVQIELKRDEFTSIYTVDQKAFFKDHGRGSGKLLHYLKNYHLIDPYIFKSFEIFIFSDNN
jgi:hypothetical protein